MLGAVYGVTALCLGPAGRCFKQIARRQHRDLEKAARNRETTRLRRFASSPPLRMSADNRTESALNRFAFFAQRHRLGLLIGGTLLLLLAAACGDVKIVPLTTDVAADVANVDTPGIDQVGPGADTGADTSAVDQPPTIKITAPADGTIANVGSLVHISANVSDDRDPVNVLTFKLISSAVANSLAAGMVDGTGVIEFDTNSLPAGPQQITLQVTDTTNHTGAKSVGILINTAPGAPVVVILPDKPTTTDDLTAKITQDAPDPDRSAADLTYTYTWFKNGQPTEFVDAVLPNAATTKGDTWQVKVQAHDPKAVGPQGSAQVAIGNAAPIAPQLVIMPDSIDLQSEVSCSQAVTATDADGDPLTFTFTWLIGDYPNPGQTDNPIKLSKLASGKDTSGIKDLPVKAGEKVACKVVVSDGTDSAPEVQSPPVSIGAYDACGDPKFNYCALAATCTNTDTLEPTCTCPQGVTADGKLTGYTGDGKICLDVNECSEGVCDANATCANTDGGYTCTCNTGYLGDGAVCGDVDECASNTAGCDLNADCSNTVGSFVCSCKAGYAGDGFVCGDVNECDVGSGGINACDLNAACSNTVGSYNCNCKSGYAGTGFACADIDECALGTAGCDLAADCSNTIGSAICTCKPGYSGDGLTCTNINECAASTSPCSTFANCTDKPGTFECKCKTGFTGDGFACVDVDECTNGTAGCGANADCTNLPGAWNCACKKGFAGDGLVCTDVDECTNGTAGCAAKALCANTIGSFTCTCQAPYVGDGKSCALQDLCKTNNGGCNLNATCAMVNEAVACTCKPGFSGDGKTCNDINECSNGQAGCGANATCTNTPGSFNCACNNGFTGDGKVCSDINECAIKNGGCDANAACANTIGGFNCACKAGFSDKSVPPAIPGSVCVDNNECAVNNGGCNPNALCTNTPGSYSCACKSGYVGDGIKCSDINECLTNNGGCSTNALCANQPGSFTCTCKPGFTGDGKTCTDVDECANGTSGCGANSACTNTPGSFSCACLPGFTGDGKTCTDINECPVPEWNWDFAGPIGGLGWVFDAPSVAGTAVKWQILNGVLYYGNGTSYDTPGSPNHGNVTGPTITFSNNAAHILSFDVNMATEGGTTYDKLFVQLIVGGQVVQVWDKTKLITYNAYSTQKIVLQGYAGKQAQIRFAFDTGDAIANTTLGVQIKNLSVVATGNPCSVAASCTNTPGSYTCTCLQGYAGDGKTCVIPGTQTSPAGSCLEIFNTLQVNGFMPAGNYWLTFAGLAPAQYYCDSYGWTRLSYDDFEGGKLGAWTPAVAGDLSVCGGWGNVYGGYGIAGAGFTASETLLAPTHKLARVTANYYHLDTWDGENGWIKVDGVAVQSHPATSIVASPTQPNICGNVGYFDQAWYPNWTGAHSATKFQVQIGSDLDQPATDESWAADNVAVWVQ